jgi:hypothetical protein
MRQLSERAAIPPPAPTFAERACQLVSFAVQCGREADGSLMRREDQLADWIWHWQQTDSPATPFMAGELGIILRALNGPGSVPRLDNNDCRELCWVLARCMSQEA